MEFNNNNNSNIFTHFQKGLSTTRARRRRRGRAAQLADTCRLILSFNIPTKYKANKNFININKYKYIYISLIIIARH